MSLGTGALACLQQAMQHPRAPCDAPRRAGIHSFGSTWQIPHAGLHKGTLEVSIYTCYASSPPPAWNTLSLSGGVMCRAGAGGVWAGQDPSSLISVGTSRCILYLQYRWVQILSSLPWNQVLPVPPNSSSHQNLNFVARNRRGRGKLQPDLHLHAALHNPQRHQVAKSPHRTHKNSLLEVGRKDSGASQHKKSRAAHSLPKSYFPTRLCRTFSSADEGRPQRCRSAPRLAAGVTGVKKTKPL